MDNDDRQVGRILRRREVLALLGAAGGVAVLTGGRLLRLASASGEVASALVPAAAGSAGATTLAQSTAAATCVVKPEMTEGPYFVDEGLNAMQALLGVPASELANIDVHAVDILGGLAEEICERVRQARDWPDRFATLDALMLRRLDPDRQPRAEAAAAWHSLARSRGQLPIAELCDALGWSDRYLLQRFVAEFGLSPKAAARVMRFDRARRLLQQRILSGAPPRLTDLALECGYYDQAHLTREFSEMAGCAPSRWVAEELRNIQAFSDELAADSTV